MDTIFITPLLTMIELNYKLDSEEKDKLAKLLKNINNIAIVGISNNEMRASYQTAKKLLKYNLFFVNPKHINEEIFGRKVYASLKDIKEDIDIAIIFRNRRYIEEIIKDAVDAHVKLLWFEPGSEDIAIINKYKDKINIIYNVCIDLVLS